MIEQDNARGMSGTREEIRYEPIYDASRLADVEELQKRVWGFDDRSVVPGHLLSITSMQGGVVVGAYAGGTLVGFVLGFLGQRDGRLIHVSHMLGVDPDYQGQGIGMELKCRQRELVLAQGVDVMSWTFDPLELRNATLNLHRLGATARRYFVNLYGDMRDRLNSDLPSDRLMVEWNLTDTAPRHLVSPRGVGSILESAQGSPQPALQNLGLGPTLLLSIPDSIQRVKRENPEVALAWRLAVREAFTRALEAGYVTRDVVDGAYVLVKDD
jgi:predicted GNAT superfamily acetyltransferase